MKMHSCAGIVPVLLNVPKNGTCATTDMLLLGKDLYNSFWSSFAGKADPEVDLGDDRATAFREFHEETSHVWSDLFATTDELKRRVLTTLVTTTYRKRRMVLYVVDFGGISTPRRPFYANAEKSKVRWFDLDEPILLHPKFTSDFRHIKQFLFQRRVPWSSLPPFDLPSSSQASSSLPPPQRTRVEETEEGGVKDR